MGQSLELKTWGGADQAFKWVLHNSGIPLATGFNAALGDGTETPLYLSNSGVGISSSGGFRHHLASAATAIRPVTLADAPGTLIPEGIMRATTDVANSTLTPSVVASMDFTPLPSGIYEFEAIIIARSAATATGIQCKVEGPAEVTMLSWITRGPSNTATSEIVSYGSAPAAAYLGLNTPAINTDYLINISGIYTVTGTPSAAVRVYVNSEVNASAVTLKANSFIRHRKIN